MKEQIKTKIFTLIEYYYFTIDIIQHAQNKNKVHVWFAVIYSKNTNFWRKKRDENISLSLYDLFL